MIVFAPLLSAHQLDKYNPCVTLIDDVFRIKARGLLVAGFASAVMLAWFCTIMYLVERGDDAAQVIRLFYLLVKQLLTVVLRKSSNMVIKAAVQEISLL